MEQECLSIETQQHLPLHYPMIHWCQRVPFPIMDWNQKGPDTSASLDTILVHHVIVR